MIVVVVMWLVQRGHVVWEGATPVPQTGQIHPLLPGGLGWIQGLG